MLIYPYTKEKTVPADDCEQVVKENYWYKVNRELGNLKLREAMHVMGI